MSIPDYQTTMLPLLTFLSDGNEHTLRETIDALAVHFNLTDEQRTELLPSGKQAIFNNRVGWARTYLKKACLLESTKRGVFKITMRGLDEVNKKPTRIDVNYLMQFPEFVEFRAIRNSDDVETTVEVSHTSDKTPEEILESAYQRMRQELAGEILLMIKSCSPAFFERLVIDLLVSMGYGGSRVDAGSAIGKSGDGGIDGIIKEDRLGLDAIYVQAKRWENPVGRPEVQKFAGALQGHRAKKGVFITTSSYTKEAHDYVSKIDNKIVLMDGSMLSNLMMDNNVGVSPSVSYELKRIDSDYFVEE